MSFISSNFTSPTPILFCNVCNAKFTDGLIRAHNGKLYCNSCISVKNNTLKRTSSNDNSSTLESPPPKKNMFEMDNSEIDNNMFKLPPPAPKKDRKNAPNICINNTNVRRRLFPNYMHALNNYDSCMSDDEIPHMNVFDVVKTVERQLKTSLQNSDDLQSKLRNINCNAFKCNDDAKLSAAAANLRKFGINFGVNLDNCKCEKCTVCISNNNERTSYPFRLIGKNISNIDDLIKLGKSYNPDEKFRYSLDIAKLNRLVEPLTELNKMVGMAEIKEKIFDMIMYYLQNLDNKNYDMLHSIITGPPGVGKTHIIGIIAKIYNRLGFLKTDNVVFAKREDFIAGYVGQTAVKTKQLLESAIGGVLVIDEAYSLGDSNLDGKDSFGREAINTITPFLSEHTHDFAMILAGYKEDIETKLMSQNPGLERRFPDMNRFNIEKYNVDELQQIFKSTIETQKWTLKASFDDFKPQFEKYYKYFNYYGGDMLNLFTICKKVHSQRLLSLETEQDLNTNAKNITIDDISKSLEMYVEKAKSRNQSVQNVETCKTIYC
jgi:hypothetical protein